MFLIYVLALHLLARQPTVLQWFRKEFLYFCDEGVYSVPCPNYAEGDEFLSIIPEGTWFLVRIRKLRPMTKFPTVHAASRLSTTKTLTSMWVSRYSRYTETTTIRRAPDL